MTWREKRQGGGEEVFFYQESTSMDQYLLSIKAEEGSDLEV
jgi:hypothetical protein